MALALFMMNKCLSFTKICSPLLPCSQGKSVVPLLWEGSLEASSRDWEFSSPFTKTELLKPFLLNNKYSLLPFLLSLALRNSQLTALYSAHEEKRESSVSLKFLARAQTVCSKRQPLPGRRVRPGRLDGAVRRRGHRGAPNAHGWGAGAGLCGAGLCGRAGPAVPLGRRVRVPAGRLLPCRGRAGNGASPRRSSAGGASAALLRDGLEAGLVEGSTAVWHLLRRRFNVCSCCPAPCSLMSRPSSPGCRSAANSGCSLTFVFGYLPGSREKLDEIGCLPWELPHVMPHSTWVLPSVAIIPQGTTASCQFLWCLLVLTPRLKTLKDLEEPFKVTTLHNLHFNLRMADTP